MKEEIKQKANEFIQKRIVETGKPFDEAELPKVFDMIIEEAKKEVINEINEKWNTGYDDICISQEEWIPFQKRHLSTLAKAKRHNSDFSKDQIKELKSRRDELRKHPERGIKLEDL